MKKIMAALDDGYPYQLEDGWRLLGIGGCEWVLCHFFPERGDSGFLFFIRRNVIGGAPSSSSRGASSQATVAPSSSS